MMSPTPDPTAGTAADRLPMPSDALTGPELVALQLTARGYSPGQIADLRCVAPLDVLRDLQRALTVLGATTVRAAVAEVRTRRLIV